MSNGNQIISFFYQEPGSSEPFNKLNYKLHARGIYSGGNLTRVNDTNITISSFVGFYEDTSNLLGIRIETTVNATLVVGASTPYIVGRFTWVNNINNYMTFMAVAFVDIESDDLVLGRLVFSGSVLTTEYDYSRKSWIQKYFLENAIGYDPIYRVIAHETYNNTVTVLPGPAIFVDGVKVSIVSPTTSPTFSLPVSSNGRSDILVLDSSGSLQIIQGVDTSGAPIPRVDAKYLPLALISFPASATVVNGSYISYFHPNFFKSGSITGTDNTTFEIDRTNSGPKLKNSSGVLEARNSGDSAYVIVRGLTPVGASDLTTKAYVDSFAGSSSIITVGTITTGTWHATVIEAQYGGTGNSSYAVGDILYASASTTLSKLADVATGNALISGGVTTAPSWGKIGLTTHISGVLPLANGGTNLSTIASGSIIATNSLDTLSAITSTSGLKVLQNSAGTISWASTTGTVAVVYSTSPTLVTPILGVATATSINGLTITTSTGTLTIANGSSLITSGAFNLTLTTSATTSATFPVGTITLVDLSSSQALTNKTISGLTITTTTGTLTIASGKTLTANSNLTLAGTDGKTLTVSNNLTLAGTDGKTLTVSHSLTLAGADSKTLNIGSNNLTFTTTSDTSVTLPTSGTLVNTAVTTLSSLVSIGTITTGVWNGTVVGTTYGGTGLSSLGTANQILGVNNATNALEYKTLTAGSHILFTHGANSVTVAVTDKSSAATALFLIERDANGRAQVVDPSASADIATKNYVDTAGGGGGIGSSFISNSSMEAAQPTFATYADGASTTPVNGTGGSPTISNFSVNTSNVLDGTKDIIFTKSASNVQGQGWSTDFTIPLGFVTSACMITFPYLWSGTDSVIGVYMYDVTNATLIPTSVININTCTKSLQFYASFIPNSSSTSYRLIFHIQTTDTVAGSFEIDDLIVYKQISTNAPAITNEQAYTPTFTGFGTVTNINFRWWRVGDKLRIQGTWTSGSNTATEARISLPSGLTSVSGLPTIQLVGYLGRGSTTTTNAGAVLIESSVSYMTFGNAAGASAILTKLTGLNLMNTNEIGSIFAEIPISGWTVNTTLTSIDEPMFLSNTESSVNTNGVVAKTSYSIDGATILANTANTTFAMTLPRPIMPNELPRIEVRSIIDKNWVPIEIVTTSTLKGMTSQFATGTADNVRYGFSLGKATAGQILVYMGSVPGRDYSSNPMSWSSQLALADGFDRWRVRIGKYAGVAETALPIPVTQALYRSPPQGLLLSYVSTTSFSVGAGIVGDSTYSALMYLSTALTGKTTSAFAVGASAGSLDTGSIATSTWYYVWLISTSSGGVDVLTSTSSSSPTMPTGYIYKRIIGAVFTDGSSHYTQWIMYADGEQAWVTLTAGVNDATLTTAKKTYTVADVPAIPHDTTINASMNNSGGGEVFLYGDTNLTDIAPKSTGPVNTTFRMSVVSQAMTMRMSRFYMAGQSLYARATVASTTLEVSVLSFNIRPYN